MTFEVLFVGGIAFFAAGVVLNEYLERRRLRKILHGSWRPPTYRPPETDLRPPRSLVPPEALKEDAMKKFPVAVSRPFDASNGVTMDLLATTPDGAAFIARLASQDGKLTFTIASTNVVGIAKGDIISLYYIKYSVSGAPSEGDPAGNIRVIDLELIGANPAFSVEAVLPPSPSKKREGAKAA